VDKSVPNGHWKKVPKDDAKRACDANDKEELKRLVEFAIVERARRIEFLSSDTERVRVAYKMVGAWTRYVGCGNGGTTVKLTLRGDGSASYGSKTLERVWPEVEMWQKLVSELLQNSGDASMKGTPEGNEQVFRALEYENSGKINFRSLACGMENNGVANSSDDELDAMINKADSDGINQVNFDEFCRILVSPKVNDNGQVEKTRDFEGTWKLGEISELGDYEVELEPDDGIRALNFPWEVGGRYGFCKA